MTEFTIRLAGKTIAITANYPSTREFCRDYLTEDAPDLSVSVSQEEIDAEREKSAAEDAFEGLPTRFFPDSYLETLAVYRKIAVGLLPHEILLFHGSVVAVDGCAYLFTAKSGTGKSTHTRLWRKKFGSRAVMVNDDKPLLRLTEDAVFACGTPWDGKHHLSTNIEVPLKGLCILERDTTNHIEPVSPKEAFPMLFQQSYRPDSPEKMLLTLGMIDRLCRTVPLYRLGCNMEQAAADVSFDGMRREQP